MSDKLPSIDDLPESNLPSLDEFITEEKELPSIDEFVEKEEEEIVEEVEEEIVADTQDLTEIVRLINDVRKDIPDIPEIKSYDEELERLTEQIKEVRDSIPEPPEIPEIKYYDDEIASLREEIDRNAADIPEIKYYDEQVNDLEEKIKVIKEDIVNLPEPKYYETDLKSLKEDILAVKESIPVFPKWVNEVNEVPDFSWIGKTFGVIDSDFVKVEDELSSIRGRIDQEVKYIFEEIDVKEFESKNSLNELTTNFNTTKDKIYEELREAAVRIHETQHSFKNDDRLLKKNILSKFNVLKQRVEEEVKEFNRKNVETKDIFDGYFTALTEEIANLPKVKYYDEDVDKLKEDIKSTSFDISELYKIVEELKGKQEVLKEELVNDRPLTPDPEEKQGKDPLTPTDQKFATLKDLAANYRLFVNRVEQQLYTIGGGGAGYIKDLADVDITGITTGHLLIYGGGSSGTDWVGIASTALSTGGGGGTGYFVQNSTGIHTTSNVGIGTTTASDALTVKGNVNVSGTLTAVNGNFTGVLTATTFEKHEVTDIYSTGIITATKGIRQTGTEGLHVTAGVSTFVGLTSCLGGLHVRAGSAVTSLIVEGDGRVTGVMTIGTGSVTLDGTNNKISVGTAATIWPNGNITCGILTATKLITSDTATQADFSGGIKVGSAATIYSNGNISAAGIVTANGGFVGSGANITTISGSNISSGTVAAARVATLNQDTTGTADNITVTANNSADETVYPIFVDGATGSQGAESDTGLTYNPSDGELTATTFTGALTGNVTGNASGSSGSCTGNAATATALETSRNIGGVAFDGTAAINLPGVNAAGNQDTSGTATNATNFNCTANNSTDETVYPVFVDGTTGNQGGETDSGFTYNPADGELTATTFTGALTGNATGLSGSPTITVTKLNVGTAATIAANGNATFTGIVTATGGLHVAGVSTFTGNVNVSGKNIILGDSGGATANRIVFGAGSDLSIYHDGSHSYIKDSGTGRIKIQTDIFKVENAAGDENMMSATEDGAVKIYYDNGLRIETTADGADIGGTGSLKVPVGSTAQRSSSPTAGDFRYNSDDGAFEGYTDEWGEIGGGGASESDTSVSSTSATAVYTVAHATYRSASIIMQIVQGSAYQVGRYLVIHDGTTATIVEESAIATGSMLGTFTASIVSSNLIVYVNMGSASSATVTVLATPITV